MSYWCCAHLQPRREALAEQYLSFEGYEVYVPLLRERRISRGQRSERIVPMFPSYAFVLIREGWYKARWCAGVISLLMDGRGNDAMPARVPDAVISDLQSREKRGAIELPTRELRMGAPVQITGGALIGALALYQGMRPRERVEVLLASLGARVTLPREHVEVVS